MPDKKFWKKLLIVIVICCIFGGLGFVAWHVTFVKEWVSNLPFEFN